MKNQNKLNCLAFCVFLGLLGGFTALFAVLTNGCSRSEQRDPQPGYAGSESCRECHAIFYEKWDTSFHGQAMQPVTREFMDKKVTPLEKPFRIKDRVYTVDLQKMIMYEKSDSGKVTELKFAHAMGGKNLYYFLTPLERGKLQVMPLAYETNDDYWYDTTTSMMRHFLIDGDEPLSWRDPMLTFNTSCYDCHVSQISKNYDIETDTYKTEWREPGISCESCHGPGTEHNRVFREAAKKGTTPENLMLSSWDDYTLEQSNHACSTCHAKFSPLTDAYIPGDNFFDHYDLICFENLDFSCEGRDLGENYTFTLWSMNPCVNAGKLDCVHCHTSSGRYRFAHENHNDACAKCHAERVKNISQHSRHPSDGKTGMCISCHMPMTKFALMRRSDHSFRPPCPDASERFGGDSACIICHKDQDEEWASGFVNSWFPQSKWQKKIVYEGSLIEAARAADWKKLPEILEFISDPSSEWIFVTSLIRLIQLNPDTKAWAPTVRELTRHARPLVRGAAAAALSQDIHQFESVQALLECLKDDLRLVRVRAATSLSRYPWQRLDQPTQDMIRKVEREVMDMFSSMPDAWSNYYNKGNYLIDRNDPSGAMKAYKTAIRLRPDVIISYVNAAVLASRQGNLGQAVDLLRRARKVEPGDGAVNLNLGLALAEQGDVPGAIDCLDVALKDRSCRAQAAFNCAVLYGDRNLDEAVRLSRIAVQEQPDNQRYKDTLEYYKQRKAAQGL